MPQHSFRTPWATKQKKNDGPELGESILDEPASGGDEGFSDFEPLPQAEAGCAEGVSDAVPEVDADVEDEAASAAPGGDGFSDFEPLPQAEAGCAEGVSDAVPEVEAGVEDETGADWSKSNGHAGVPVSLHAGGGIPLRSSLADSGAADDIGEVGTSAPLVPVSPVRTTLGASSPAIRALLESIREALALGQAVTLPGLGVFSVQSHPARTGRNPRTGERITIPPGKRIHFKTAGKLRQVLSPDRP